MVRIRSALAAVAAALVLAGDVAAREHTVRRTPPPPLDATTLYSVSLEVGGLDLAPGQEHTLALWSQRCCVYYVQVFADVRFYMDPSPVATLDPITGTLRVSPDAVGGTSLRVYGDIDHGRRIVSAEVHIETKTSNPFVGVWHQVAEISCDGFPDTAPRHPITELIFRGDRTFSVTWLPFEVYRDYWGFYSFDRPLGRMTMAIRDGNYVPSTFRGDGTYKIENDTLRISGVSFGRQRNDALPPDCGGVFVRYH